MSHKIHALFDIPNIKNIDNNTLSILKHDFESIADIIENDIKDEYRKRMLLNSLRDIYMVTCGELASDCHWYMSQKDNAYDKNSRVKKLVFNFGSNRK